MNQTGGLDRIAHGRAAGRWNKVFSRIAALHPVPVATPRDRADDPRPCLDRMASRTDRRTTGAPAPSGPCNADWIWRPEMFRGMAPADHMPLESGRVLCSGVQIFHDCRDAEITLMQQPAGASPGTASQALEIDVLSFGGDFLSVVIDLPDAAIDGLGLSHVIQVETLLEAERPLGAFLRLNLKHGPNIEQMVRELATGSGIAVTEFDLAYAGLGGSRIDRAWIDVILQKPALNRLVLGDFVCSRRLRAEL